MIVNFLWKRLIISRNYFERVFQKFWPHIKKQILYRRNVLESCHFWAKLPLTAWQSFLFSTFVCFWFLILHARIQSAKESRVVTKESFSNELKEAFVHKCSKKGIFKILGELTRKHLHLSTTYSNRVMG